MTEKASSTTTGGTTWVNFPPRKDPLLDFEDLTRGLEKPAPTATVGERDRRGEQMRFTRRSVYREPLGENTSV